MSSSSAWTWQPAHSLYYNSVTQIWAAPQPDGSWHYSNPVPPTSQPTLDLPQPTEADPRPVPEAYEEFEEGEVPFEEVFELRSRARSPGPVEAVPLLRLVVNKSEILPARQKVVVVDAAQPLTIGRDRLFERRVRLKELAVSKTHASLFWTAGARYDYDQGEGEQGYWAIADYGSTQGTWLTRGGSQVRLSEAKVASAPWPVLHNE